MLNRTQKTLMMGTTSSDCQRINSRAFSKKVENWPKFMCMSVYPDNHKFEVENELRMVTLRKTKYKSEIIDLLSFQCTIEHHCVKI